MSASPGALVFGPAGQGGVRVRLMCSQGGRGSAGLGERGQASAPCQDEPEHRNACLGVRSWVFFFFFSFFFCWDFYLFLEVTCCITHSPSRKQGIYFC